MDRFAATLVKIIAHNFDKGIEVHCTNINEFVRELCEETGTTLIPKNIPDYYESQTLDRWGEPYINKRINKRKNLIIMPSTSLKGLIVAEIGATENVTDSFKKRALIVDADQDQQYPTKIKFEAIQAKCDDPIFEELRVGDEVTVHFNFRGNEYTNKDGVRNVINTLAVWKIEITRTVAAPTQHRQSTATTPALQQTNVSTTVEEDDDLPF